MSPTVELSPRIESRLRERANGHGDFKALVEELLQNALDAEDYDTLSDEDLRRIDEAIDRGDADVTAGRVRPIGEFFAYMQAKYSLG